MICMTSSIMSWERSSGTHLLLLQSFVFVTDQGIHSEERPILMGSVSNPGRHNKILVESASPQDR